MDLPFRVEPLDGEEPDELLQWVGLLVRELGGLDEVTVERGPDADGAAGPDQDPDGGLTVKGPAIGTVFAQLSRGSVERVLEFVRNWAARTGRTVELKIGEDWVKVAGLSNTQQDRMIASWLAVHPAVEPGPPALPSAAAGPGGVAPEHPGSTPRRAS